MSKYSLAHLTDGALLNGLKTNLAYEHRSLALVLAHIAEVGARRLYREAGYPSMHAYCVHGLHLSPDAAYKRIQAARAARDFPALFERVAEGALSLSVVNLLASHLTAESIDELLAAAAFKTRFEVEELLASRCPQQAVETSIEPIAQALLLGESRVTAATASTEAQGAPGHLQEIAKLPSVTPIASDHYRLQLTMSGAMYEKLRIARTLLAHRKPNPDEAQVLELGLDLLVARLERRKFGATDRPRTARRSKSVRNISSEVKRQVWARDGGRCTFTSDDGTRCPERRSLEWDHVQPVARGGSSEANNIRLRCRAHNQLEAERVYGKQFMQHKREQAEVAARKRRAEEAEEYREGDDVIPWLRRLGVSMAEARFALDECGPTAGLDLETRLKRCLAVLAPPHRKIGVSPALH